MQHLSHSILALQPIRAMLSIVRRRVLKKGPDPQFGGQEPIVMPHDVKSEAEGAKRQVYLVTFPHPRPGSGLVAPTSMSRVDLVGEIVAGLRSSFWHLSAPATSAHCDRLCSRVP